MPNTNHSHWLSIENLANRVLAVLDAGFEADDEDIRRLIDALTQPPLFDERNRLLDRRNHLMNSFGGGSWADGRIQELINEIDAQLKYIENPAEMNAAIKRLIDASLEIDRVRFLVNTPDRDLKDDEKKRIGDAWNENNEAVLALLRLRAKEGI